jgi:hypothetical protein
MMKKMVYISSQIEYNTSVVWKYRDEFVMMIEAMIQECDYTDRKFDDPVSGYHVFARGATGRVCCVMYVSKEAISEDQQISSFEELEAWAESVPGGYLDY